MPKPKVKKTFGRHNLDNAARSKGGKARQAQLKAYEKAYEEQQKREQARKGDASVLPSDTVPHGTPLAYPPPGQAYADTVVNARSRAPGYHHAQAGEDSHAGAGGDMTPAGEAG